ncbi:hypothetical protein IWQ56_007291, partial [Coemansia nantahalensis]
RRKRVEFAAAMLPADFCERYSTVIAEAVPSASRLGDPLAMCRALKDALGFEDNEMAIGSSKVFMDFATWRRIDDPIRALERGGGGGRGDDDDDDGTRDMDEKTAIDGRSASRSGGANAVSFNVNRDGDAFGRALRERPQDTDARSFYSDDEAYHDILTKDAFSDILSEGGGFHAGFSDMLGASDDGADRKGSFEGSVESEGDSAGSVSGVRRTWLFFVRFMTWMVPSRVIACCGKRRRKDEQVAWREKLTLCMLIFWSCAFVIFWICGLGLILCPHQNVYSIEELGGHNSAKDALIAIRGEVFNIKDFTHMNINSKYIVDHNYLGHDLSTLFPLQLSFVCPFS